MIRYDVKTLTPYQAVVAIDAHGDFSFLYEPLTDPLLRRYLAYQRLLPASPSTTPPLIQSSFIRSLYAALPFAPNLSKPDWIPTKATLFLEKLRETIPGHRLMIADFSELPDTVEGRNGPVVQTRLGGSMIPCETILVKQGFFDIFFPTGMLNLIFILAIQLIIRFRLAQGYVLLDYELSILLILIPPIPQLVVQRRSTTPLVHNLTSRRFRIILHSLA
jgi:hypothetical protein